MTPHLSFVGAPSSYGVGVPGPPIIIQRLDAAGVPVTSGALAVSISTSTTTGRFLSSATEPPLNWSTTGSITIPDGASTASFHYADGAVGLVDLRAQATGFDDAAHSLIVTEDSFNDDFESGTVLRSATPPGKWFGVITAAGVSVATSTQAPHRGAWGLLVDDTNSVTGSGVQGRATYPLAFVMGRYQLRFWYRVSSMTTAESLQFVSYRSFNTSDPHNLRLTHRLPSGELGVSGVDELGNNPQDLTGQILNVGTWYLIELEATGMGTAAGARRVWVNGVLRSEVTGLDWRSAQLRGIDVGEPWAVERQFTGNIQIDDVRGSTVPQASTLRVSVNGPAVIGACVPVNVTLVDSSTGANAPAPYSVVASLSATGASGTFHPDAACATTGSSVTFPYWGTAAQILYFMPSATGTATLTAGHVDFLSTPASLTIDPPLAQGAACQSDLSCASGNCVDGVCCDSACTDACTVCNRAGTEGQCTAAPDGTSCEDGAYCNGVEQCTSGTCQAGAPVVCVDPQMVDVLVCDEGTMSCAVVPSAPPQIVEDAQTTAGVGIPYAFNADGVVHALGERPMTFSTCGAPESFTVDAATGAVSWTPSVTGVFAACILASNEYGQDTYDFVITVFEPQGAGPDARLMVSPTTGDVPLVVMADGSASTADASTSIVTHSWDFGEGAAPSTGVTTSYVFRVPGTRTVTLTVVDGYGRKSSATQVVTVRSRTGEQPPSARIVASVTQGSGPLEVAFECDCQAGTAPVRALVWDFGDGSPKTVGERVTHVFQPGRYTVRLTVADELGLTAVATQSIVVLDGERVPPDCAAFATPSTGTAPLQVLFGSTASTSNGAVARRDWTLWDDSTEQAGAFERLLDETGRYVARLRVVDEAGLQCLDSAEVVVMDAEGRLPPQILFVSAATAECAGDTRYLSSPAVIAVGDGPLRFSGAAPAGEALLRDLSVHPDTGAINWSPTRAEVGARAFMLRVESPAGAHAQRVEIQVTCGSRVEYTVGCGATAKDLGRLPLLLVSFLLLLRRKRVARSAVG